MNVCLITTDSGSHAQHRVAASEPSLCFYELAPTEVKHHRFGPGIVDLDNAADALPGPMPSHKTASKGTLAASRQRVGKFLKKVPAGPESVTLKPASRRNRVRNAAVRLSRKSSENVSSIGDHRSRRSQRKVSVDNFKVEAQESDLHRSIARVVHDLRTPLMASNGYCDLLLGGAMGTLHDEQAELVERIRRSLGRLARLTDAMLQLTTREVESQIQLKSAPIQTCIERALNEIGPLAGKKKLTVAVELDEARTHLPLDSEQIERVLINLLENSCKFTPKGGKIQIRAYAVAGSLGEQVRVDVVDTGTGIAAENLERVFEEYASYGGAENSSGRGLGLAICKTIVTAHGGRIWAEKHRGGAKISFVLPAGNTSLNWSPVISGHLVRAQQSA